MAELVAVTNRRLCQIDFLTQLDRLIQGGVDKVVLREKDLSPEEYRKLAEPLLQRCSAGGVECILHSQLEMAVEWGQAVHLPLPMARACERRLLQLAGLGISVHSVEEAVEAVALGATYLTAGHIFPTACKPDLPARGLEFLQQVCAEVSIPVYAIGGMDEENAGAVIAAGAAGVCRMSWAMTASFQEIWEFRHRLAALPIY